MVKSSSRPAATAAVVPRSPAGQPCNPKKERPLPNSLLWISQRQPDTLKMPADIKRKTYIPKRGDRHVIPPTSFQLAKSYGHGHNHDHGRGYGCTATDQQHFSLSAPKRTQTQPSSVPFIALPTRTTNRRRAPTSCAILARDPPPSLSLGQIRAGSTPSRTSSKISDPRTLLPPLTGKIPPSDV